MHALSFFLSGLNAQNCPSDLELTFGTPTQVGNLVGVPVILNSAAGSFNVHGVTIDVYVSPFTNVTFDNNASNASVNSQISSFASTIPSNGYIELAGFDLNNVHAIAFSGTTVNLFTVFFTGDPGQCYDLSFSGLARFIVPPITNPVTFCEVAKKDDQAQHCFEAVTIEGNVNKVLGPACNNTNDLGINEVNISIDNEVDPNNLVNICLDLTDASGVYDPCVMAPGDDVRVSASKEDNFGCGLDDDDLTLIHNHVLAISQFTQVWEWIAADINNNGTITAYDEFVLKQHLLNGTSSCGSGPCNSWDFIPKNTYISLTLTPPSNAWLAYDPHYHYPQINSDELQTDFYGIKNGDVNNSCTDCDEAFAGGVTERNHHQEDRKKVKVKYHLTELSPTEWQLKLNVSEDINLFYFFAELTAQDERFSFVKVEEQVVGLEQQNKLEKYNLRIDNYNGTREGYALSAGQSLFSILVKGEKLNEQEILKHLTITGIRKPSNIISADGNKYFLDFTTPEVAEAKSLLISPNPFSSHISMTLPATDEVSFLRIFTINGQLVYQQQLAPYETQQQIPTAEWPKGILFYELITSEHTHTGKLIHQ